MGWIGVAPSAEDDGGLLLAALLCPAAPESPARLGAGSTDSPSERADLPSPASVSGVHGSEPKVMLGSDLFLWCPGLLWYLPPTPSSVLDVCVMYVYVCAVISEVTEMEKEVRRKADVKDVILFVDGKIDVDEVNRALLDVNGQVLATLLSHTGDTYDTC